jgi:phage tail sheath protein FI
MALHFCPSILHHGRGISEEIHGMTTEAFFVHGGLGATMTAQDILDGRLTVEVGMAVVRPAEFIVLRFSHKVQTG